MQDCFAGRFEVSFKWNTKLIKTAAALAKSKPLQLMLQQRMEPTQTQAWGAGLGFASRLFRAQNTSFEVSHIRQQSSIHPHIHSVPIFVQVVLIEY